MLRDKVHYKQTDKPKLNVIQSSFGAYNGDTDDDIKSPIEGLLYVTLELLCTTVFHYWHRYHNGVLLLYCDNIEPELCQWILCYCPNEIIAWTEYIFCHCIINVWMLSMHYWSLWLQYVNTWSVRPHPQNIAHSTQRNSHIEYTPMISLSTVEVSQQAHDKCHFKGKSLSCFFRFFFFKWLETLMCGLALERSAL